MWTVECDGRFWRTGVGDWKGRKIVRTGEGGVGVGGV